MSTRVLLVRHGATKLTAEDRFAGDTEVDLSDLGRDQVHRLAIRLSREAITAVYASPMGRTVETAAIIAEPHKLTVATDPRLREISHGHWEGRTRREVEQKFPDEYINWENDPFSFAPRGGETGLAVTARALPALLEIVGRHSGEEIVVVSHKATIRLLLSSILGFEARAYRDRLDQSPAALNILDFRDATRARLALFNDTSHYSAADSTLPPFPSNRLSKWWDTGEDPKR